MKPLIEKEVAQFMDNFYPKIPYGITKEQGKEEVKKIEELMCWRDFTIEQEGVVRSILRYLVKETAARISMKAKKKASLGKFDFLDREPIHNAVTINDLDIIIDDLLKKI